MELIYPYDTAPMIPLPTAETSQSRTAVSEWFPIVDQAGFVVGRSTREYCHSGAKPLHPVIHIHIIDRMGRIYLQKRSMRKDIQPGKWDTAVGGHVSYGEMILEAAYREASEEVGLTAFNPIYIKSYEFESEIEKELVNVFAAVGSFELHPDMDEVDEGRWWDVADIDAALGQGVFTPNFESEFQMIRSQLLALL
jgi:isopentenyldiphosphate isomerase